jgi:hypothetical protein
LRAPNSPMRHARNDSWRTNRSKRLFPPQDHVGRIGKGAAAVQFIGAVPVFVSVYDRLDGVNGPPTVPEEVRPPADTVSGPATAAAVTVMAMEGALCSPWVEPVSFEFPNQAAA